MHWKTQKSSAEEKGWFFTCMLFYYESSERQNILGLICISKQWLLGTVNNIFAMTCFCSPFSLVSSSRAVISKSLQSLHLSSASQFVLVLTGIMQLKSRGSILEMKECRITECIPCQFSTVSCYVFNCQLTPLLQRVCCGTGIRMDNQLSPICWTARPKNKKKKWHLNTRKT